MIQDTMNTYIADAVGIMTHSIPVRRPCNLEPTFYLEGYILLVCSIRIKNPEELIEI